MRAVSRPYLKTGPRLSLHFKVLLRLGIVRHPCLYRAEHYLKTKEYKGHRVNVGQVFLNGRESVELQDGAGQGVVFKRSLLLYQGEFMGQFGPVKVTDEMLEAIANRFNKNFANPKNQFDYPPLLVDHDRKADLIKGRLTGPLVLEQWEDPRDGKTKNAIFSDVRVDNTDAQEKVAKGQYSHLSLSFSDEIDDLGEIFELSFVAVEAARGAQVLQQGEPQMSTELQAQYDKANLKIASLKMKATNKKVVLSAGLDSLSKNLQSALDQNVELSKQLGAMSLSLKTNVVQSQLNLCVKEGKLTPDEMKKLDVKQIALMDLGSRGVVLSAYQNRPPSSDVHQHGMHGAKPLSENNIQLSGGQMKAAIAAQLSGKEFTPQAPTSQQLAGHNNEENNKDAKDTPELTGKAIDESLATLEGITALQEKITESGTRMQDILSKLQGNNDEDKKEDEDAA